MLRELNSSLRLMAATIVVCCVLYPLSILAFAALSAPEKRLGSLIEDEDGRLVGSSLIAQSFARPEYFWPRPSAVDYNAAAAAGSNLSPTNTLLRERAEMIIAELGLPDGAAVPTDLVAASGSGLDPHISAAAAEVQLSRIARTRHTSENEIRRLMDEHLEEAMFSARGEGELVNVLLLNLALDRDFPISTDSP
jgi:K+-transporting ATPase ATPase C chain